MAHTRASSGDVLSWSMDCRDDCERSGPIEDYNAAQWITTNCAKSLTTPRRYGADMAHTVASIGQVLSWRMACHRSSQMIASASYALQWIT